MSKGIAVIAIIGLILGASGLTIGIISWIPTTNEQTTWYSYSSYSVYSDPVYGWQDVPTLIITFNLKAGESVYFSYVGEAIAFPNPGGNSFIQANLKVDGVVTAFSMWVGTNSTTDYIQSPISLQVFTTTLSAGVHNVTIAIAGNYPSNCVNPHTLFVQKYPTH